MPQQRNERLFNQANPVASNVRPWKATVRFLKPEAKMGSISEDRNRLDGFRYHRFRTEQFFYFRQSSASPVCIRRRLVFGAVSFNTGISPVSFAVDFIADDGAPLTIPSVGSSTVVVNLAAGGIAVIEGPNSGPLNQGYVSMSLPSGVAAYGVFRQSLSGVPDQEAVVPLSSGSSTASTSGTKQTSRPQ
jgi:hypothetical protein